MIYSLSSMAYQRPTRLLFLIYRYKTSYYCTFSVLKNRTINEQCSFLVHTLQLKNIRQANNQSLLVTISSKVL